MVKVRGAVVMVGSSDIHGGQCKDCQDALDVVVFLVRADHRHSFGVRDGFFLQLEINTQVDGNCWDKMVIFTCPFCPHIYIYHFLEI